MTDFDNIEVTDRFFEQYESILNNLNHELAERLVATECGIIVSVDTGENARQTTGVDRWPVTLSVTVPTTHVTLDKGDPLGYLHEDTRVPDAFRHELVERLYDAADLYEIDDRPGADPESIHLYVAEVGPATVTYDKTTTFPRDEVIPDDESVYEVVHRTTEATRVHVTPDDVDAEAVADAHPGAIIRRAERDATDDTMSQERFNEVIAVREVENSRAERERAYEAESPLTTTADGDGIGLRVGDVLSVGDRTLIAARSVEMGFRYNLHDAETGEWVMRLDNADDIAHYEHDPAGWAFLGRVDDDFHDRLRDADNPAPLIADTDIAAHLE